MKPVISSSQPPLLRQLFLMEEYVNHRRNQLYRSRKRLYQLLSGPGITLKRNAYISKRLETLKQEIQDTLDINKLILDFRVVYFQEEKRKVTTEPLQIMLTEIDSQKKKAEELLLYFQVKMN